MTTKDAIKLLPLDEKLKMQVLNLYDFMEPEQKLTVAVIAWRTYFLFHEQRAEANLEKEINAVTDGVSQLGSDFYDRVLQKTDHEEKHELASQTETVDLALARHAMEQIINEIRNAKKKQKVKN